MASRIAKIGERVKERQGWLWTAALMALAAWPAYNLGLLRAQNGSEPLQEASAFQVREGIVPRAVSGEQGSQPAAEKSDPRVVVSKSSSSKKYHHAWCPGAKQIKESNRAWYPTAADAVAAGYSLAGNCRE